ncbi:hypothetical protein OPU71_20105 [Niveibacterium sp. 24ML]|uniref:hypothetical protein n=1 Tax=Niveibacterium sp. 24ML TaxID=2985512 RepID=UPI002270E0ED|nr:hypothetical protein [Niveibacterium sp. 24ML]MCX9158432.1 hypothetical protein [Niveibacterium sp. 24ML]
MTSMSFALAVLALLSLAAIAVWLIHRSGTVDRQQAAAWRYLAWNDESLALLRSKLQAPQTTTPGKRQQAMLTAVEAAMGMRAESARRIAGTRHDFRAAGPMELRLIALRASGTDYEAGPICIGRLNLDALYRSGRLSCVSDPATSHASFAAVMTRETLRHFMLPENDPWFLPTFRWYSTLPSSVSFVLAHLVPLETPQNNAASPSASDS